MIGFRTIMTGGMKSQRTVPFSYPKVRLAVSLMIAAGAYSLFLLSKHLAPGPSDFSVVWHGARLLFDGKNPYDLIGPGRPIPFGWNLHYPASTLVAAFPLALLPESFADSAFVFGSAFLLAYGALKENLNRIWIFASAAFVVNAKSGQWSALIASIYFLPLAAVFAFLKPTDGLAVLASRDSRSWIIGGAFAAGLIVVSLAILPEWPREWYSNVTGTWEFVSPVRRWGGWLLVLALLRWRSSEARLLLALALVPQVQSWYTGLLPMLVARSIRESQVLALVSSLGYLLLIPLSFTSPTREISAFTIGHLMVAFCYLPALIVVLRRPDEK